MDFDAPGARCAIAFHRVSPGFQADRKSTRLNSSHSQISYAVFCLKKKKKNSLHLPPCSPSNTCLGRHTCLFFLPRLLSDTLCVVSRSSYCCPLAFTSLLCRRREH